MAHNGIIDTWYLGKLPAASPNSSCKMRNGNQNGIPLSRLNTHQLPRNSAPPASATTGNSTSGRHGRQGRVITSPHSAAAATSASEVVILAHSERAKLKVTSPSKSHVMGWRNGPRQRSSSV